MNKAIFLDRDGTINVDYGYVCKIEDFKFIDGAIEGLKILNDLGYKLIVISNQSAIARRYCTKNDVENVFEFMKSELEKNGVKITDIYYCPHLGDECECRKPKLELFYKSAKEHDIDFSLSYAIGDKKRDVSITEKENIKKGIIIGQGQNTDKEIYVNNLLEAAKYIQKEEKNKKENI